MASSDDPLDCIESDHGVAVSESWTWKQSDGTPVNLTGHTFTCHIRAGSIEKPGAVKLPISTTNGKITTVAAEGLIKLSLTAAESLSLPPGKYWFELIDGTQALLVRGIWTHRTTGRGADGQ